MAVTYGPRFKRWLRRGAISGVAAVALLALLGFVVAPPIARHVAEKQLGLLLGRKVGIGHIRIRPATPRLNGKVERLHRIDSEEFYRLLEGQVIDDVNLFNDRLQQLEDYYNYDRSHGALAGSTPYERL